MSYTFKGGIHPPGNKTLTCDKPIREVFIPKKVVLPLSQHVGAPAEPVVTVGDSVKVGGLVGKAAGFISSSVHSSLSGKVTKIFYSPTPNLGRVLSVLIEAQGGEDQEFKPVPRQAAEALSREELIAIIKDAGVVGLGGAAFPAHVKLSPPKDKKIDTVLLNGAECEPYLTCDHRIMIERSGDILKGLGVIVKILGVKNAYIAVEDNKPESARVMKKAVAASGGEISGAKVEVIVLKTKYPQGAEKQLIKSVLNRVVPAGALPMDAGCVVHNTGTAAAIYEAVCLGKPLFERVITVTGNCVREPMNMTVRAGTLVSDLVEVFGGFVREPRKIVVGGPMTGTAQFTMDIPVTKGTSGILFMPKKDVEGSKEGTCIRCGKCVDACPMRLVPTALMHYVKKELFADAKEKGIMNCFECGACVYDCPAKIPLLDYMKYGKSKI